MPEPRPLHVLLVASSSLIGGAEQSMLHLIANADPKRLRFSLVALMGDGPLPALALKAGAVNAEGWKVKNAANPRLIKRMHAHLVGGGYDLVQTFGLRADLITRWVAHGQRIKLISSIRSVDAWRRPIHTRLDRMTRDGVTAWISNSLAGKRASIEREGTPAERIFVVPNGIPDALVPDEDDRARARETLWLADKPGGEKIGEPAIAREGRPAPGPIIAVVANLTRAKGHRYLIEAVGKLAEEWPGLVCVCAGRDESKGAITAMAKAGGPAERFRWTGFLKDPAAVYAAADLIVLPSLWEGMPHTLIEAMRAGRACVATRVGGVPEMITDGVEGLLCEATPAEALPEALATAIGRLLRDPGERRKMEVAARQRFKRDFRVERMVESLTGIYEAVAGL